MTDNEGTSEFYEILRSVVEEPLRQATVRFAEILAEQRPSPTEIAQRIEAVRQSLAEVSAGLDQVQAALDTASDTTTRRLADLVESICQVHGETKALHARLDTMERTAWQRTRTLAAIFVVQITALVAFLIAR